MIINNKEDLRTKIENFALDAPDAALTFTQRLAKENNWDVKFAQKVVTEYKRYVYLCAISSNQLSPSEEVDQAWHMHMTYTESYWTDLCARTLGKPLHHNPTRGGPEEREKFFALYENTLAFYQQTFHSHPPTDVWPPAEKRFAHTNFIRVDKSANWIISKPKVSGSLTKVICTNIVAAAISLGTGNWVFLLISVISSVIITSSAHGSVGGSFSSDSGCWGGDGGGGDSGCGSGCGGGCGGCGGGCS